MTDRYTSTSPSPETAPPAAPAPADEPRWVTNENGEKVGIDLGNGLMTAVVPIHDRHVIPAVAAEDARAADQKVIDDYEAAKARNQEAHL
jgi:hypothetical protein